MRGGVFIMKSGSNYLQKKNIKSKLFHLVLSLLIGFAAFTALMCLSALIMCNIDVPLNTLSSISMLSICVSVFVAGMILAMFEKKRGLIYGALMGVFTFFALWLAGIINGGVLLSQLAVIKAFSIICSGAFGGLIGVIKSETRRKIR